MSIKFKVNNAVGDLGFLCNLVMRWNGQGFFFLIH